MYRKTSFGVFVVGLVLVGLMPTFVLGQGFTGGRGRFGDDVSRLLNLAQVQQEIALSAEQKASFQRLLEIEKAHTSNELSKFDFVEFQKLPEAEQAKRREAMSLQRIERSREFDEKIKAVLKVDQWTRLNQIRIQQEGVWCLARTEVQKQLGLTDEQVAKIKALVKKANEIGGGNALGPSPDERRKLREENEARRQAFEKNMTEVLSPDQLAAWKTLKGTPFEISR